LMCRQVMIEPSLRVLSSSSCSVLSALVNIMRQIHIIPADNGVFDQSTAFGWNILIFFFGLSDFLTASVLLWAEWLNTYLTDFEFWHTFNDDLGFFALQFRFLWTLVLIWGYFLRKKKETANELRPIMIPNFYSQSNFSKTR
jgi:hypothetical protein